MSSQTANLNAIAAVVRYLETHTPQYTVAYNVIPEPLIVVSTSRHIAFVNNTFCDYFGYARADLIGQSARMLYRDAADFTRTDTHYFNQPAQAPNHNLFTVTYQRADGSYFLGQSLPNELRQDGNVVGYLGVLRNVGERVTAERNLELASSQLHAIFDSLPSAMLMTDLERNILMVNPLLTRLFGYSEADLVGQSMRLLLVDDQAFRKLTAERINTQVTKTQLPYRQRYLKQNGDTFVGETLFAPVQARNGKVIGYGGLITDITNQASREAELAELNARLEQSVSERTAEVEATNAELRDFAYSVSHDLGSPLRAIRNYATFIMQDYGAALPEEARSFLTHIDENAAFIDRITQDLLQYTRIGQKVLTLEQVAMKPFLAQLIRRLGLAQKATLTLDIGEHSIMADYALLEQIFSNLLENAVTYVAPNTIPKISITATERPDAWWFSVADNGIGIEAQHLQRIFGVFERLHLQSEYPGTGIGLAVVKRAIEYMGGTIQLQSVVGEGSTFHFSIAKQQNSVL